MKITHILTLLLSLTQVDIVGDKVDTEKIINSLMDESFPSLTLTDQFTYHKSGELNQQHNWFSNSELPTQLCQEDNSLQWT